VPRLLLLRFAADEDKGEDDEAAPAQAEQLDPEELLRRAEEDAGEVGGPGSPAAW
jgi:hypothetical protein